MVHRLYICEALRLTTMARITPIDVIRGISGKYGSGSSDYFATNTSSNRIHLAKYLNKPTGEPSALQKEQIQKFTTQARLASAWLRANHPSPANGDLGTEAYQEAQALKRQLRLSNVRQVVIKYMDAEGNVTLPASGTSSGGAIDPVRYTLTLSASPSAGGTVTGAGLYAAGTSATISAQPASGYTFQRWSDGDTNAQRTVVVSANLSLSAIFQSTGSGDSGSGEDTGGGME